MTEPTTRRAGPAARLRTLAAGLVPALVAAATLGLGTLGPGSTAHAGTPPSGHAGNATTRAVPGLPGVDVARGPVDWAALKAKGVAWASIKATEGTSYQNPSFAELSHGADEAGLIHGAYHFARPDASDGAAQARFFVSHGGAWSADGRTLPGLVDLEYNPNGPSCYGLTPAATVTWISDFTSTYHSLTTRWPVVYTTTSWWRTCTGDSTAFATRDPLFISHFAATGSGSGPGPLPGGWTTYTFWQYADGSVPGQQDVFNGDLAALRALALG